MIDFNYLPRFRPFHFEIVTRVSDWARVYQVPEPEIERQIGIAHVWIQNNPKRSPKKDVMRFLHNWLAIAQRNGSLNAKHTLYKDTPAKEDMTVDEMIAIRKRNLGGL